MPFHTTVLYPNQADVKFDMDYYLKTHMPLVQEKFGPHGLKRWEIVDYKPGADGAKPAFIVGATLVWDSPETMGKAMTSEGAPAVFGDIPNFTNVQPTVIAGDVVKAT